MNIAEFKTHLRKNPDAELRFLLPDGGHIPLHAHLTEVGRVDKAFMDCGGTERQQSTCLLQTWVAEDTEHRFTPGKLADVLDRASHILRDENLPVEIEYEDFLISQFPVAAVEVTENAVTFALTTRHTDCLAKDVCVPETSSSSSCCGGGGCC